MSGARRLGSLLTATLAVAFAAALVAGCGFSGSLLPAANGRSARATSIPSTTTASGGAALSGPGTDATGSGTDATGSGTDATSPGAGSGTSATTPSVPTTTVAGDGTSGTGTGAMPETGATPGTATATATATITLPGTGKPTIEIGDENTPEQFILGELYKVALTYAGFSTTITQNIGTPAISLKALQQGTLDLYPVYLNEWDSAVAGMARRFRTRGGALAAAQQFAQAHGLQLLTPTPFSDTQGIAVTTQFAQQNSLRSLRDLATTPIPISIGTPLEFSQPGGILSQVERTYSFVPSSTPQIDIGSQYRQLYTGKLQAAFVQTTDWQLAGHSYKVLGDPKHVFGFGNVVPVTTDQVLAAEGPAFAAVINKVDAMLTRHVIRYLNYLVADLNELPEDVATRFLQSRGILPPSGN